MLFNSLAFALFLPLAFAAYWAANGRLRVQNLVMVVASCVFYGWWDLRFLLLLLGTSLLDFMVAAHMGTARDARRKRLLAVSITANLGVLGVFKYFDFFSLEFARLLNSFGFATDAVVLDVMLPVGVSFYTFQALSYTIDVYRGRLEATRDPIAFLAFIALFPQLVAGPIERASHLLPQVMRPRTFDANVATDGLRQMLWGFFKKVVIADNCAPIVNDIFAHPDWHGSPTLVLGALLFSFQIYGDFSGYSDIAIGCARLFGFDLMRNFAYPYFSRDIAEFWRRWHISLSTWFRDYVYMPLGGSYGSKWRQVRNVAIIFLVSGFWHGANWTYLAWGGINALLFLPLLLRGRNRRHHHLADAATWRDLPAIVFTFGCTTVAWIFFRAASLGDAVAYVQGLVASSPFHIPHRFAGWLVALIGVLLLAEWGNRSRRHTLELGHLPAWARRTACMAVFLLIFFFGRFDGSAFIYFQF